MKKRYTISYDYMFDMVVTIDHSILTDNKLHEINNFWSGAEDRLRMDRGDIVKAVLRMLALHAFRLTVTDLDPVGRLRRGEEEGWPPLDGSEGIQLMLLDDFQLEEEQITIKSEDA